MSKLRFRRAQHKPDLFARAACRIRSFDAVVRVQVVEAKDEVTFLDDVGLMIGAIRIAPRECSADSTLAYCGNDRRYARLARGESLSLTFDVPIEVRCGAAALSADGYDVPVAR